MVETNQEALWLALKDILGRYEKDWSQSYVPRAERKIAELALQRCRDEYIAHARELTGEVDWTLPELDIKWRRDGQPSVLFKLAANVAV